MEIFQVRQIENRLDEVVTILLRNDNENINVIDTFMKDLSAILSTVLSDLLNLQQQGVELPVDIILNQVENLKNSYANKDMVMMADCLMYEIKDTLIFYIDVLKELGKEE